VAMMLRYTLARPEAAAAIESAVSEVLDQGLRTPDICTTADTLVDTTAMGDAVIKALNNSTGK
jgi:3-isopropylmalate dehydrogenase